VALLQNDILTNDTLRYFCTINPEGILKSGPRIFLTNLVFNFSKSNGAWNQKNV